MERGSGHSHGMIGGTAMSLADLKTVHVPQQPLPVPIPVSTSSLSSSSISTTAMPLPVPPAANGIGNGNGNGNANETQEDTKSAIETQAVLSSLDENKHPTKMKLESSGENNHVETSERGPSGNEEVRFDIILQPETQFFNDEGGFKTYLSAFFLLRTKGISSQDRVKIISHVELRYDLCFETGQPVDLDEDYNLKTKVEAPGEITTKKTGGKRYVKRAMFTVLNNPMRFGDVLEARVCFRVDNLISTNCEGRKFVVKITTAGFDHPELKHLNITSPSTCTRPFEVKTKRKHVNASERLPEKKLRDFVMKRAKEYIREYGPKLLLPEHQNDRDYYRSLIDIFELERLETLYPQLPFRYGKPNLENQPPSKRAASSSVMPSGQVAQDGVQSTKLGSSSKDKKAASGKQGNKNGKKPGTPKRTEEDLVGCHILLQLTRQVSDTAT